MDTNTKLVKMEKRPNEDEAFEIAIAAIEELLGRKIESALERSILQNIHTRGFFAGEARQRAMHYNRLLKTGS